MTEIPDDGLAAVRWSEIAVRVHLDEATAARALGDAPRALALAHHLPKLLADYELELVRYLRDAGATWRTIGEALGVTKQTAQGKFSHLVPVDGEPEPASPAQAE